MHKNIKKLIKFFLIFVVISGIAFFGFMAWVAIKIVSPAGTTYLETEGSKVAILLDCKQMLSSPDAWNPTVNYNYVYYLREKHCPPPEKLQNVEEVQKEYCERLLKEDPKLHQFYAVREKICSPVEAYHYPIQEN